MAQRGFSGARLAQPVGTRSLAQRGSFRTQLGDSETGVRIAAAVAASAAIAAGVVSTLVR